jgi:tRNA(Ile)-lysidine synthase
VLEEINPNFLFSMDENMERNRQTALIFQEKIDETRELIMKKTGADNYEIRIEAIRELNPLSTWLYELFAPFGFTRLQCADLEKLIESPSGKQFISTSHILYKDREKLFLTPVKIDSFERFYLDRPGSVSSLPFPMDAEIMEKEDLDSIPTDPSLAYLDMDLIQFPLTIRHWLHGDYFMPLGMSEMKKVSNYFIDMKVPMPEKNRIWILASGKKIVWIMGMRIDERFKISDQTKKVLKLKIYLEGSSS